MSVLLGQDQDTGVIQCRATLYLRQDSLTAMEDAFLSKFACLPWRICESSIRGWTVLA